MIGIIWKSSHSSHAKWNIMKECVSEKEALEHAEIYKKKYPTVLIFAGKITNGVKSEITPVKDGCERIND